MKIVRSLLAGGLLAFFIAWPSLTMNGVADAGVGAVSAAPSNDSRHPEKEEKNRNENWNANDNRNSNRNDNRNGVDGGDDERGNARGNRRGGLLPSSPPPPRSVVARCYAAGESGALTLSLDGGTVTLDVVSASSFSRASRVTLGKVDPASVPATPGPRLDEIVFELRAQDGCDGSAVGELPADANLGVSYRVPAEKATLRLAVLDGGGWVDVPTVPDPSNPYVSATVRRTGVYVLYQAQ